MKLVLPARALGRRVTVLATAFVLAVSSLTAVVPFVLSEVANATAISPNTVTASNVTQDSMTLNFNIVTDHNMALPGATGIFETQVDNESVAEYAFPVGATPAPFNDVASFVQVREQVVTNEWVEEWTDWKKFYVAAPAPDTAPTITINGAAAAKRTYPAGIVRIQVADTNYSKTVIQKKNGDGVYVDRFTYNASKGKSFTIQWLGDGEYRVQAHDTAGNTSKALVFAIDTSDPQTTFETPALGQTVGGVFTLKGKASDNINLNRVYVQLVNRDDNKRYAGHTVHLSGTQQDWTYTINANTRNLPEGTYAAHVSVVDNAGNTSSVGWTANFKLDKTVPVFEITSLEEGDVVKTNPSNKLTVNGSLSDSAGAYSFLQLVKNGASRGVATVHAPVEDGTLATFDTTGFEDGQYQLYASPTDYLGNAIPRSVINFTVDNTMPELSVDAPADFVVTGNTVNVTGTVFDDNLNEYKYQILDENKKNTLGAIGWSRLGGTSNKSGTLFTADVNNLGDGTYYISVWANDKAGNTTTSGNRLASPYIMKFTIDRTGPKLTIAGNPTTNSLTAPTIRGTADANEVVAVTINRTAPAAPITATVVADANGDWFYTHSSALPIGTYDVTARAVDEYGNATVLPTTLTIGAPAAAPARPVNQRTVVNREDDASSALNTLTPLITNPSSAVLGTSTEDDDENNGTQEVKGTSNAADKLAAAVGANNTDGNALGLAWYWWLLIIAGGSTIIWGIVSALRGRPSDL